MPPRRSLRWLVALAVAATALPSLASAARAQTQDPNITAARAALDQAQADAHTAANKVQANIQQRAAVQAQVAQNQAKIAQVQADIPVLKAKEVALRQVLAQRAAALYVSHGPMGGYDSFLPDPSLDQVRRQVLANDAAKRDHQNADALAAVQAQLAQNEQELEREQSTLAQEQSQLDALATQLQFAQAVMNQKVADANAALQRAEQLGALRQSGQEPVQGPSVLTGAQMAAWINSQGYQPRIQTSIEGLANTYIQEGSDEGVRGDVAFAQAVVETGGFQSAPSNNYAGMGWCDGCSSGTNFPTPGDGVRAQIQHLLNYADSSSRASKLHHPPSPFWYGSDPGTAAANFDNFFAKGWAPTWNMMGHGNWATDPGYSGKVLRIYNEMLAFAQAGG